MTTRNAILIVTLIVLAVLLGALGFAVLPGGAPGDLLRMLAIAFFVAGIARSIGAAAGCDDRPRSALRSSAVVLAIALALLALGYTVLYESAPWVRLLGMGFVVGALATPGAFTGRPRRERV